MYANILYAKYQFTAFKVQNLNYSNYYSKLAL